VKEALLLKEDANSKLKGGNIDVTLIYYNL
jgi:hypothetical protein